jgi:hypothetical protein
MFAMMARLVAVNCKLFSGVFPSERQFEVALADGETYRGLAPRHFCWNASGKIVEEEEVTDGADGWIAGKRISYHEELPEGVAAIEVPDGEVLAVNEAAVRERPTKISPPNMVF